jgi:transmembrane sensor
MTNVYSLHTTDDAMFDQASVWIAKMDRNLTEPEQIEFKLWLAGNEQHQKLIIEMAIMWDKMDSLDRLADLFPVANKKEKGLRITQWSIALAASVVLALFAAQFTDLSLNSLWQEEPQFVRYETAVGENSTIYLPDRSKVLLNTDSVLLVQYTDDYRLLDLQRGELHVEVAHDKSRPLSVIANQKVIQAVGTAFSVQVNTNEIELIVTEGKVIIGKLNKKQVVDESVLTIPSNALAVSKGEIAKLATAFTGVDTVSIIDKKLIKQSLSWRQGNLVFNGETLAEAMKEVSRYTAVTFEIADDDLKKIRIAGRFKTGDVKGLIAVLNHNFNIKTDRINKELVILRKQS